MFWWSILNCRSKPKKLTFCHIINNVIYKNIDYHSNKTIYKMTICHMYIKIVFKVGFFSIFAYRKNSTDEKNYRYYRL